MEDMNTIKIETEDMGEFSILLTDEQISIALENGASYLESIKNKILNETFSPNNADGEYWGDESVEVDEVETEYGLDEIDWTSYFPTVSSSEIEDLIEDSDRRENELKQLTTAGLVFLSAGLSSVFNENVSPDLVNFVQITKASGSFFEE